ncbi:MAG TPA: C-type lectin domain-containing protein [Sandaracinaceae bacterium LLY-WYZ-13_1]|nr:C-type lectin domain-containing protein [Sandaracinaceae bacterium LLY-WYZ-13_1]
MSRVVSLLVAATFLSGCFVERSGTASRPSADGGARPDAQAPSDDAGTVDGGPPPPDADPPPADDAGPACAPGFVDVDGDPSNGCECPLADPPTELCNGRDDDCDRATPDGAEDPDLGGPCDGPDTDRCPEGRWVCNAGARACSDATDDTLEVCDGSVDEDCDSVVDEAGAADASTFYDDDDGDGWGDPTETAIACDTPSGFSTDGTDCDDTTPSVNPGQTEVCNGRDDDCTGGPDDGACATCETRLRGGRPYLFCDARNWRAARDHCASFGDGTTRYRLVQIQGPTENGWVATTAGSVAGGSWWIGANDRDDEDTWVWADGTGVGWTSWGSDEPNNGGIGTQEDCVELYASGSWNDQECDSDRRFVCEWPE